MADTSLIQGMRLLHALFPIEYRHPDPNHEHEMFCDPVAHRLFGAEEIQAYYDRTGGDDE